MLYFNKHVAGTVIVVAQDMDSFNLVNFISFLLPIIGSSGFLSVMLVWFATIYY